MATKWPAPRTSTCARRTSCRRQPRTPNAGCADGATSNSEFRILNSEFVKGRPQRVRRPFFDSYCLLCQHLNFMAMTDVSTLGEFEQVVLLAILRLADEAYAVTVRDEIVRCTGRDVSRGSVYITLDRLETKGYLRSRLADPTPERGGRAKRYYALRPRAVEALRESRPALIALWRGLESLLA